MDIILKNPIEELTPKIIAFNNVELMEQAKSYLETYQNMVFDDNSIAEAKEVRAKLNKISSELNKFRIGVQKVYEAPSKYFKSQVDEVANLFDETSKKIGSFIDDYTERQKQEKRNLIAEIYKEVFGTIADMIPLEKFYNSKWENKTYRKEQINDEIQGIYNRVCEDIEAIYSMENVDHITLKLLYFKYLNLGVALTEYQREEKTKAYIREKEEEKMAKVIDWNAKVEKGVVDEPTPLKKPFEEEQTRVICFKCELTNSQAKALKQFFVDNNIKYEKI